jgi:hypothetical protein
LYTPKSNNAQANTYSHFAFILRKLNEDILFSADESAGTLFRVALSFSASFIFMYSIDVCDIDTPAPKYQFNDALTFGVV